MARYRRTNFNEVDAIQWTGENTNEVKEFAKGCIDVDIMYNTYLTSVCISGYQLFLETNGLRQEIYKGDYIVKDSDSNYYTCKPSIFESHYVLS